MITTLVPKDATLDQYVSSPAFRAALSVMESLGPVTGNPGVDRAYRTLRLLGLSKEDAIDMIESEIARRSS